jgi:CheY-like chemotaxis protein
MPHPWRTRRNSAVEDDPASARLLAMVLATEGPTHVRVAHSAEEALAVLRDDVVRVLIVDVALPGMSGLLLVRRLKSEVATRHIIAIAVSGWDEAALATDAMDSGCVAVVRSRSSSTGEAPPGRGGSRLEGCVSRRGTSAIDSLHARTPARAPRELADRQPQSGDLFIVRQAPPDGGFGVSQWPGAVQLSFSRRDAATELARRFGERHRVDVWETHGDTCTLVASYRRDL